MGWMSERENVTMPCCAESDGHAMKNLHNDASKTTFNSPYPLPSSPLSLRNSPRSIPRVPVLLLYMPSHLITHHYAATSAIHAQRGSAPLQKSGSRQPDATAQPPGPAPQHQRCHPPPYRRRRHRCPDQRRPTSAHRTAGPGEVAPGVRPVRVRTLEVEAAAVVAVAVAAAVAASVVETVFGTAAIAAVAGAAVVERRVPRETRR